MKKIGTGSLSESRLVKGVVLRRRILLDSLPNDIFNPKVACLDGDIKIREMTRDVEIKILEV